MNTMIQPTENVPEVILLSILRDHIGDPEAQITNYRISPISTSGASGNNSFYQADLEWINSDSRIPTSSTSWLIKHWKPGGLSQSLMGWNKPMEALAWQHGILRPESLPRGIHTPILGAVIDPGGEAAWVAMADISKELREYDRAFPMPTDRLILRVKEVLSGLAQFHACWEQPERKLFLDGMDWLLPFENFLWRNSANYAACLDKDLLGEKYGQVVTSGVEERLNVQAFLKWLEPSERSIMENLLVDRSRLTECFAGIPWTLLHGDLDDRNIGLSWSSTGESKLSLIDWEWMGRCPAAMDVAKVLIQLPLLCQPGSPILEDGWLDELGEYYYTKYRETGEKQLDYPMWRRSYDLALIAHAMWSYPLDLGNILRTLNGEAPLPQIPGLPEEVLRMLLASSLDTMKRMKDLLMQSVYRSNLWKPE